MRFSDIPGHEDIKRRLREMVHSGHIPHALLLEGPGGTGKFALARAFVQYLHCTERTAEGEPCGRCPNCIQHEHFNHIDTFFSFPVVKRPNSNTTISDDYIGEFRTLLQESPFMDMELWLSKLSKDSKQAWIYADESVALTQRLVLTPRQAKYKVVLLWLPERMNEATANKLLKLIEEPYGDTLFVMTSDNPAAILPTIYSRTQRISVPRQPDSVVASVLEHSMGIDSAAAQAAAALADGDLCSAIKLVGDSDSKNKHLVLFMSLMRLAWMRKVADLRAWASEIATLGREGSMRFYEYCSRMIRENFIFNIGNPALNALTPEERDFSIKFAPFINVANVEAMFATFDAARNDTLLNANVRIVAFDLAVKMILLIKRGQEA